MAATSWRPGLFRWQLAPPADGLDELARSSRLSPLLVQILHNRGCRDSQAAQAFLNPKLTDLHDPAELPGTVEAARRIAEAAAAGKRIIIYGDFDVDGQTSVAILHACLKQIGADVHYYVPHRLEEGYGINRRAMSRLIGRGMGTLITVDCGITAVDELGETTAAGVEVILTDHHLPPATLPNVAAIVHPSLPGGSYPNPSLCGAGVAFKLAWQIARQCCKSDRVDEAWRRFLLDATALAALGTVADVVPLLGENRALVPPSA